MRDTGSLRQNDDNDNTVDDDDDEREELEMGCKRGCYAKVVGHR